jgi:hypothetical protein
MILTHRIAVAVSRGEVRLAFRRWRRPAVRTGDVFHSSAGLVRIDSVEIVEPGSMTTAEARAAGFDSVEAVVATFRAAETDPVFRIGLSPAGPDPRVALSRDQNLSDGDVETIAAALGKLDRMGPWTHSVLRRIAAEPGVPAAVLASEYGLAKDVLKRRVRQLKALGLTHSLDVGYAIAPRGAAYLGRVTESRS